MESSEKYIEEELEKNKGVDLKRLEDLRKKKKENKDALNQNVRRILLYSGFIGAVISAIAYLIATFVMITGVSADLSTQNQVLFSVLGAIIGVLIATLLRSQGVIYAKQNPEVQEIMKSYSLEKNKTKTMKQLHTITWYLFWATVQDVLIKGSSAIISMFLIIYIFVEGSGDWGLLWLAISNIGLFTGFGLVSLSTIYEKYIENHLPAVIARIEKLKEQALEKDIKAEVE